MPAKDQNRGQRDNHYRNVVRLAGAIGAAVEDNRYTENEQRRGQRTARLDDAHSAALGAVRRLRDGAVGQPIDA